MKIRIIGPNKLYKGDLEKRKKLIEETAKIVASTGNEIILTPDKGSLLEYFGRKYLEFGGKKIYILAPVEEKDHKDFLCTEIGEIISCIDWDRQANEFNRQSELFICLGYSWGTMKEIACSQYFNKKKTYIVEEFISGKLPEELNSLVEYIKIKQLKEKV